MAGGVKGKSKVVRVTKEKPDLRKKELPLIDVKVTNPITYIKSWWRKIIGNEGVDFRVKVRPLTAIAISIIIITVSLGMGRFVLPFKIPFFEYASEKITITAPSPQRQAAFSGRLEYDNNTLKYYLLTGSSEAILLSVPDNLDLSKLKGRRILASGKYFYEDKLLIVESTSDLELLPTKAEQVPTSIPSPTPTATPKLTPTVTPTPETTVEPANMDSS